MTQMLGKLYQEFQQLPAGFRVVSGILGGGALLCLGLTFSSGLSTLVPILVILLGVGGLFAIVGWLARGVAKKRSRGLGASLWNLTDRKGRGEGSGSGPASDADAARRLRERWRDVYQLLSEKGYDFYSRPWFLVIGPSQSGKTTLIQKSNQEFPIGDKPVADFGTKNCNWFFTNKAILIDTAGRYVEHLGDEGGSEAATADRAEWETFLALLRRFRTRSPINGLILVLKVPDILDPDLANRERTAEVLRKALLDIEEQLKIQVPVYVMVTMCDRLMGFNEFFSLLPGLSDRSLLGWSRTGHFDQPMDADGLQAGLGEVVELLARLRLGFLNEMAALASGDPEQIGRLDRLYVLPDEFSGLVAPLLEILKAAFRPSSYYQGHFFRGVYFTSALQKGEPVLSACRNLLGSRSHETGLGEMMPVPGSKAFFIADFFEEKVFPENGLVKMTTRANRERRRHERVALIAGALLALGAIGWAGFEGCSLRGNVGGAERALDAVLNQVPPVPGDPAPGEASRPREAGREDPSPSSLQSNLLALEQNIERLRKTMALIRLAWGEETLLKGKKTLAQTFATGVFLPLVRLHLAKAKRARTWSDGIRTAEYLTSLHELAFTPLKENGPERIKAWDSRLTGLLGVLERKEGDAGPSWRLPLDLGSLDAQTGMACRGFIQKALLASPGTLELLWSCLEDKVAAPWLELLGQLEDSPAASIAGGAWTGWRVEAEDRLKEAWSLDLLYSLDRLFISDLRSMKATLQEVGSPSVRPDDDSFRRRVREPWNQSRDRILATLKAAQGLAPAFRLTGPPGEIAAARLEQVSGLKRRLGRPSASEEVPAPRLAGWVRLEESLTRIERRIDARNSSLQQWFAASPEIYLVRTVREGPLGGQEGQAPTWRAETIDAGAFQGALDPLHSLVNLEVGETQLAISPGFWDLSMKERRDAWLGLQLSGLDGGGGQGQPAPKPGGTLPAYLVAPEDIETIRAAFRCRLLFSFFSRIRDLCTGQRAELMRSLDDWSKEEIKQGQGFSGSATFLPEKGYRYTRRAAEKLLAWIEDMEQAVLPQSGRQGDSWPVVALKGPLEELRNDYGTRLPVFWTEGIAAELRSYLPVGGQARPVGDLGSFLASIRLAGDWPAEKLLPRLEALLNAAASQYTTRQEDFKTIDWPKDFGDIYRFWERCHDQAARKRLLEAVRDLVTATLGEFEAAARGKSGESGSALIFNVLEAGRQARERLTALRGLMENAPGDPILAPLAEYGDRVRDGLKALAELAFKEQWVQVEAGAAGCRSAFPFRGAQLPPAEKGPGPRLAPWEEARRFLGQNEALGRLDSTIGEVLLQAHPPPGASAAPGGPAFQVALGTPERRECFRQTILLRRAFAAMAAGGAAITVEKVRNRTVEHSIWDLMVGPPGSEVARTFNANPDSFIPFRITLPIGVKSHRIFLRANNLARPGGDGGGAWESFHPLPPASQGTQWDLFAWLWLWGEYEAGEKGFWVKVRFPPEDQRGLAGGMGLDLADWQRRLDEYGSSSLEILVKVDPPLPETPPDFNKAGWK